jgi:hypothetical protein
VTYLRPKTKFVVITSPRYYDLIGSHPNIEFKSNITEETQIFIDQLL